MRTMIHDLVKTRIDLGQRNRRLVLAEILFGGPIPRARIAERIGLTAASVSRITRDLIDAGLVEEGEDVAEDKRRGRRFVGLKVIPRGCFVAGVAINAFRQDVVVADLTNATLASRRLHFDDLGSAKTVLEKCAEALNALIDETRIDRDRLIACGVTIAGAVDPQHCTLRSAPTLGWEDVAAGEILSALLGVPVFMENIPNAKNLSVHSFGSTRELDNVVLFNASLAIGCSLLLDGRLIRGSEFKAGLLESMMIPDPETGRLIPIDELAGGLAVLQSFNDYQLRAGSFQASHLLKIIADADDGHQPSIQALERAGTALGFAIANTYSLLHPETIVLSGPLMESGYYYDSVRRRLSEVFDAQFVQNNVRWVAMSSQEAAQSLAIYQSLVQGKMPALPQDQTIVG